MNENIPQIESGLVSIIIPTYNRANLLARAIESCLKQTYQKIEIIIIDDESTDNTQKVVANFCKRWGETKIRYVRQKNQGVSAARNTGMQLALGEFIQFLDSDDYMLAAKIQEQINYLLKNDSEVSVCNVEKIVPHTSKMTRHWSNKDVSKRLVKFDFVQIGSLLIRRCSVPPCLTFRYGCSFGEDLEFMFLYFLNVRSYVHCTEEFLKYDLHDACQLTDRADMTDSEWCEIFWSILRYVVVHKRYVLAQNNWMVSEFSRRLSQLFLKRKCFFEWVIAISLTVIYDPNRIVRAIMRRVKVVG